MQNTEKDRIVLVAAKKELLDNIRVALANTNFGLLHVQTKQALPFSNA